MSDRVGGSVPKNRDRCRISITINVGDQVLTVVDVQPIRLGGNRRGWRKQIADQLAEQFAELRPALGVRFGANGAGAELDR